jgi:hypothetical protein
MKKTLGLLMTAALFSGVLGGCAYGAAVAVSGDKVVILRNDSFLFGALRKAFVCKAGDGGLTNCADTESP